MRMRIILGAALLVAVLIVPFGTAQAQTGARKVFQISVVSFKFTPSLITVNRGDTVVLRVSNDDPDKRNHSIAARWLVDMDVTARGDFRTGVAEDRRFFAVEPGKTFELEFVAKQAGSFPFVCGVFDHGARGQSGAINVIASAAAP